jgi:hypothetical protein
MYVRSMVEAGVLEGLAAVSPGPELSAALNALDPRLVPSDRVVEVMQAQARQCAHEQARLWATMVEVGLAEPVDDPVGPASCAASTARGGSVADWAPGEIAAALTWTHRTADWELGLADVVVRHLPDVFAALSAGLIDRGKAVVFAQHLDPAHGLTPAQTEAILARLLPVAPRLTTSQLRGRLWRALLAIDPGWARRRYTRAVRARTVTAVLADDGTVSVTGSGLPADEAAVACARVDRLAEAAKRAGHPGRVGQIAADVFLGLLDGRFDGRSEEQIIAALLRESRPEDRSDDSRTDNVTCRDAARDDYRSDKDAEADDTGAAGPITEDATTTVPATDNLGGDQRSSNAAPSDEAGSDELVRVGIEVRVGLTTLIGLDERPGEIPGLGPVLAPVARAVVARQLRGAEWRFAVTDDDGHLLLAGVTRHRPSGLHPRTKSVGAGRCRGGIVELHVSAAQLARLAAECHSPEGQVSGWAAVVADIAARYAGRHAVLAGLDERSGDRFPGAALARHIQVRDRTCSHPGCRRPARRCDLDHTRDHARGGPTVRANLGPGCARHHRFKHELGWRLAQPRPGLFEWTSPLGQIYRTRGEPIALPLPEPVPRPDEPAGASGSWYEGPILLPPDPSARTEPRPSPADHEPPPF